MSMKWNELTAVDFPKAIEKAKGVCVIPFSVIEKHGNQLPLGTDGFVAEAVAERAAAIEPVIVFPSYWFGQIHEAKHCPGTIAVRREILFGLLDNLCDEIARNGCKKIVLLNGHGGNEGFLAYFNFTMLERRRDFNLYIIRLSDYRSPVLNSEQWKAMQGSEVDHHAGEVETSTMLDVRPELVKMQDIGEPGLPRNRLAHLGVLTPMRWYADYPDHYAGDARSATAEKGRFLMDGFVAQAAELFKRIKNDQVAPDLEREFFRRSGL